jgi:hypothetical protein
VSKEENRIVCYLDEDTLGIVKQRSSNRGVSANLYAKRLIEDAIHRDTEGLAHAINHLAGAIVELQQEFKSSREDHRHNFKQLGKALETILSDIDEIKPKGR